MSITSWVNYQQAKQHLVLEASDSLHQSSEYSHVFIDDWFSNRVMDIKVQSSIQGNIKLLQVLVAGLNESGNSLKEYVKSDAWAQRVASVQNDLETFTRQYDFIYDVFLIDSKSNILFTVKSEEDLGLNLLNSALVTSKLAKSVAASLQTGSIIFSDIERYAPSENRLAGFLTAPIIDATGNAIGVFALQLDMDRIFDMMVHQEGAHSSQNHYLVGSDGLLRSPISGDFDSILKFQIKTEQFEAWHHEHQDVKHFARSAHDETPNIEHLHGHEESISEYIGPMGTPVFGIHQSIKIKNVDWALITEMNRDEVLHTSTDMATTVLIALLISVLIIIIIGTRQIKRITTPLSKLSQASHDVALGKNHQQIVIDNNNEIGQLAHAFNNMLCKQREAELKINKSNSELRSALAELSIQQYALDQHAIVAITDKAGTIVFVNDKFCEVSGYSEKQLIGANHRLINSGVHPKPFFKDMFATISRGTVWHGKICNRNQSGELYWVETTITPYKDEDGEVQQYIAIRTDITNQKAFEEEQKIRLKVSAIKLAITDTLSGGSALKDQLSDGLLYLFQLPNFNLKPQACLYILDEDSRLTLFAQQGDLNMQQSEIGDKYLNLCEQGLHSNGNVIDIPDVDIDEAYKQTETNGNYIVPLLAELDEHGVKNTTLGVILLFTGRSGEIDDYQLRLLAETATIFTHAILRDKANRLLEQATQAAEQSNQLKGEFLASMSHEIRTPMNGVLGMLGLLLNSELNDDQRHKAALAKSSAESLLILINDILDFSKVEAGKMELEFIDFNLRDMLGEVAEAMALQAQEKGVEIILDVAGVEHSMVKGDSGRIRQVITNLISNAIKFTEQGEVKISAAIQELQEGELLLTCHVEDSGIGIAADKVAGLFETFTQVDASTTRKYGGTGLGLAICKKLSFLMGGDVEVQSVLDKGSTFSFTAKLQASLKSQRVLPLVDISKLDLLIVDDNTTNLEVLRGQLEYWGAKVTEANSGGKALEICQQRFKGGDKAFDVALLDMQMPGMDGIELGKALRAEEYLEDMKLVMMTSIATQSETKLFAELGFSAYFPKPTTTSDLFQVLNVVVDNGTVLQEAVPLVTHDYLASLIHEKTADDCNAIDKSSVKILLVEDNKVNQLVAVGILQGLGFDADIAENGEQALTALRQSAKDEPYNLIFMDCQMPIMDGYQATESIRRGEAGERYNKVTIIAMTANVMEGDRDNCLQSGMDDYIGKPIEPQLLESKLFKWIEHKTTHLNEAPMIEETKLDKQHMQRQPDRQETANEEALETWHQESALQRLVNSEELLVSLINTFIEEIPSKIEQFSIALETKNRAELAALAHNIKGASANLSALKLAHYCLEIEQFAKSESPFEAQHEILFTRFKESYHELIDEFNAYLSASVPLKAAEKALSCGEAISFLTTLKTRLVDYDYIESSEITALIDSNFSEEINGQLNELQQMITLFELSSGVQFTDNIIALLQDLEGRNS